MRKSSWRGTLKAMQVNDVRNHYRKTDFFYIFLKKGKKMKYETSKIVPPKKFAFGASLKQEVWAISI